MNTTTFQSSTAFISANGIAMGAVFGARPLVVYPKHPR